MKVALVCIAKNEDPYIQEWIEYHTKLGFDHVFVFMNDWRTDYEHPQMTKHVIDGLNQQRQAYSDFLSMYRNEYDWAAFFDVDEFLVLKKHDNVKDYLSNYINYGAIGINWTFFGNNGHTEVVDGEYSQLKRFTKRQIGIDQHVKTILQLKTGWGMDVHHPSGNLVDSEHRQFRGPFNPYGTDNIAQLNHYWSKTPDEFARKCDRGRADTPTIKVNPSTYNQHNSNEIEDTLAVDFMYKN